MAGLIPESVLEDILSRVDIVQVISEYMPLKKAGRNFRALCPFHHEKTPSFMISPDRQIFRCFGCGESGNVFKFLMKHERMEFREAVEMLAKKAGIILPEVKREDQKAVSLNTQLYKINELAALFFEQNLNSSGGQPAKNYLLKRNIKEETIKTFRLGLTGDSWDGLINHLRQKGINLTLLEKAGLILPRQGGGYYDRFRNRVIFPIVDVKSRVLGFGARIMEEKDKTAAKYINSPETPVYVKGRNLYGLNLADDAIRQDDSVVVVEGYLDFMMPYQEGVRNIVASQGTALTEDQVRLIKRYTHNVVMVYDADDAGQAATLRSLDTFIEEGMNVSVVTLPPGDDPDSFVRKMGIEAFREKINQAQSLFDYKLKMAESRHDIRQIEGKAGISREMLPTINKFKNAILQSEYIKKLSSKLSVKEEALLEELKKIKPEKAYSNQNVTERKKPSPMNPTEKLLIRLMLEETSFVNRVKKYLQPADFEDERSSRIISIMFDFVASGKEVQTHKLVNYLEDNDSLDCICEAAFNPQYAEEEKEKVVDDCIKRIKGRRHISVMKGLEEQIRHAENSGDEEKINRLRQEFCDLIKRRE